jgi:hypothetical protein
VFNWRVAFAAGPIVDHETQQEDDGCAIPGQSGEEERDKRLKG